MPYVLENCEGFDGNAKCIFCRRKSADEFNLGKIYKYGNVFVHYYCMLFASRLHQNGADDKGILGFLIGDIRKEVKRAYHSICQYCQQKGASSICSVKGCKIKFHFPCGIENNSFHTFFDQFRSYCFEHRRVQNLPTNDQISESALCTICQDEVCPTSSTTTLWATCCKTAWFHRLCLQKMALSAGYFFKCPNCSDNEEFRKEMLKCGIYIPDQDAAWELEPNSYGELNERYNACDADVCLCSRGRSFSNTLGPWVIIICNTCGSQGIHKKCGKNNIDDEEEWTCSICSAVLTAFMGNSSGQNFRVNTSQLNISQNEENVFCQTETELPQKSTVYETPITRSKARSLCCRKKKNPSQKLKRIRPVGRPRKKRRKYDEVRSSKKRIRCKIDDMTVLIPSSCKCELKSFWIPMSPLKEEINLRTNL